MKFAVLPRGAPPSPKKTKSKYDSICSERECKVISFLPNVVFAKTQSTNIGTNEKMSKGMRREEYSEHKEGKCDVFLLWLPQTHSASFCHVEMYPTDVLLV
jgi:hypothetical protein